MQSMLCIGLLASRLDARALAAWAARSTLHLSLGTGHAFCARSMTQVSEQRLFFFPLITIIDRRPSIRAMPKADLHGKPYMCSDPSACEGRVTAAAVPLPRNTARQEATQEGRERSEGQMKAKMGRDLQLRITLRSELHYAPGNGGGHTSSRSFVHLSRCAMQRTKYVFVLGFG